VFVFRLFRSLGLTRWYSDDDEDQRRWDGSMIERLGFGRVLYISALLLPLLVSSFLLHKLPALNTWVSKNCTTSDACGGS
jgi:hypothetical protein